MRWAIAVGHVSVYRWMQRFTPEFIEAARPCRHAPGDRWFVDETHIKVAGQWTYRYRAVDQHGLAAARTGRAHQVPRPGN